MSRLILVRRQSMRYARKFFFVVALLLTGDAAARDPLLRHFEGTWGVPGSIESCEENAETISFSPDGSEMQITYSHPLTGDDGVPVNDFRYQVLGVAGSSVRMKFEGETRTTSDGELVVWDLVRISGEAYCWHRADWEPETCTPLRIRCKSILDEFERKMRRRTSDALDLLMRGEYEEAAALFTLLPLIPESERQNEHRRLTNSLAVIVRELGAPMRWSEVMQDTENSPELVNVSVGPSHVVVSQEHGNFFRAFFRVSFTYEGSGFFRAAFNSSGEILQMTFSLPRERSERMAEIGAFVLRETAHEF